MSKISLQVNGQAVSGDVDGSTRLLDFVRDSLELTGTKEGCAVGECGACTVILNGDAVCSCLVLAAQCDNATVTTVEGLASDSLGRELQTAFVEHGGVQCGFCTPGVLMSAKALLDKNPKPSDEELLDALEGNICRCTGYQPILQSLRAVIDK
ncbi:MAG: (2Fe-2S)-binding protein [Rhodoferax sp.]|jgi:carbon-monoxide dehydrogenase small subunit|uniref:(2Fe-2S)-binding protein n=1 Tax=Rhodoferax sp. TaxID=50421 RepID=UPI001B75619D|nr:(2Fe-2S)-binding protein [Rhodoferax sp.]MBP9907628.1 (2Fe-2S)-binding protein [Rhodoferax sp.]